VIIKAPLICIALRAITFFRPPAVGQQSLLARRLIGRERLVSAQT